MSMVVCGLVAQLIWSIIFIFFFLFRPSVFLVFLSVRHSSHSMICIVPYLVSLLSDPRIQSMYKTRSGL